MTAAERLYQRLIKVVASRRSWAPVRWIARACGIYLNLYENHSYEPSQNGESRVIDVLSDQAGLCVFDVGANVGDWAAEIRARLRASSLHCFEIVPTTAEKLAARYAPESSVHVNAFGLAAAEGTVQVRFFPGFAEGSSVTGYDHGLPSEWLDCPVRRGDDYCREAGVEHIDLLKIDAEGSDLDVLQGFERMFGEGRVRAAQFEYGRANIISHALLRDFDAFFTSRGYVLGKIYPKSVEFRDYAFEHEDFRGPNFLAIRRDDEALRLALASPD